MKAPGLISFAIFLLWTSAWGQDTIPIHGIHLTIWAASSAKQRAVVEDLLTKTELNAVVIDIKESEGDVYVPGAAPAERLGAYTEAFPELRGWIAALKKKGIYTIARQVAFKDNKAPRKNPAWGVKRSTGDPWMDYKGRTWLDPHNQKTWHYNLVIAQAAARLGFDEIQFDYLRFPSDGNIKACRYSAPHSAPAAREALLGFTRQAVQVLHPMGVKVSVDVFGITASRDTGVGIGQHFAPLSEVVDFICPMTYPSHYYKGEFDIPEPNKEPYRTVHKSLSDAIAAAGAHAHKIRPWLQDFSLGVPYGRDKVRAQIQAAYDVHLREWLLWNPRCVYTRAALEPKSSAAPPKNP